MTSNKVFSTRKVIRKTLKWGFFCACTMSLGTLLRINQNFALAQSASHNALMGLENLIGNNVNRDAPRPHSSWVTINGERFSQEHTFDALGLAEKQAELQGLCWRKGGAFQTALQSPPEGLAEDSRSLGVCVFLQAANRQPLSLSEFILSPQHWRQLKRLGFEAYQARALHDGTRVTTTRGALSLAMLQTNFTGDTPGADLPALPRPAGKRILSLGAQKGPLAATYQLPNSRRVAKQRYVAQLKLLGYRVRSETAFGLVVGSKMGSGLRDSASATSDDHQTLPDLPQPYFVSFATCLEDSSGHPCSTATLFMLNPQ